MACVVLLNFSSVLHICVVTLTCITLSFPGMNSNAVSLKLLAPLIPLKPQRLPLAFSHEGSVVVFIVGGLIFSKAPCAPHKHTIVHTLRKRRFLPVSLNAFPSLFLFSSSLSLIISGICSTMEMYFSRHLNVLSSFLSYQY